MFQAIMFFGILGGGFVLLLVIVALASTPRPRPVKVVLDDRHQTRRRPLSSTEVTWIDDPYGD